MKVFLLLVRLKDSYRIQNTLTGEAGRVTYIWHISRGLYEFRVTCFSNIDIAPSVCYRDAVKAAIQ